MTSNPSDPESIAPDPAPQRAPEESPDHDRALMEALVDFAHRLPTDTRRVFTLRKVYELSHHDIAAQLSMSVAEVERHLVEAALQLAQSLEPL